MNQEEATTIIEQLAGSQTKLNAMIGATNFILCKKEHFIGFTFSLCQQANFCKIYLNSMDLYDMEFWKFTRTGQQKIKEFPGLYNDMLTTVFETFTGLYLSL